MPEPTAPTTEHHASLGTGNGLVQFVCCARTEYPFDALWTLPGGRTPANVFYSPRQSYDMVISHLTAGNEDRASLDPILEAADRLIVEVESPEPWRSSEQDVRPAIEYVADQLDNVDLAVRQH